MQKKNLPARISKKESHWNLSVSLGKTPQVEAHYANKDFWTQAVFFVAGPGQLNKAHVQYLEAQLVSRASDAKRMPLDNGNKPTEPTLSEADRADMDVFLGNILGMLPVLGVHAFEQSLATPHKEESAALICQGKGIKGTGYDTPQGFVVQKDSFAATEEVPSLKARHPHVCAARADLRKSGVLVEEGDKLRFTQDYTFNSPSLAAAVILGRPANGRTEWKDQKGRTLKEIQEAQAKS